MTRFASLFLLLLAVSLAAPARPAVAAQRVALVIGNADYIYTAPLANPVKDAADMAATLRRLGFKVMSYQDLDRVHMERAFRGFARALADAETALFYYAGHGLQVDGRNYLVPIDAELASDIDIAFLMTGLDTVLRIMTQHQRQTNLVFLDASRPNPLADNLISAQGTLIEVGRGLAAVEPADNMLVASSTAPDEVLIDRSEGNSAFTAALLAQMDSPEIDIAEFIRRVRAEVAAGNRDASAPWSRSTLTSTDFAFVDPEARPPTGLPDVPPEPAEEVPALMDRDAQFWSGIRESEDWQDYQAYLDRFGEDGTFAPLALLRRDRLKAPTEVPPVPEVPVAVTAASDRPLEPEPGPEIAAEPDPDPAPLPQVAEHAPEPRPAPEPLPAPEVAEASEAEALGSEPEPAPPEPQAAPAPPSDTLARSRLKEPTPEQLAEVPPIGEPWGDEPWEPEGEAASEPDDAEPSEPQTAEAALAPKPKPPPPPKPDDPLAPLKAREQALTAAEKEQIQTALTSLELYDGPIDGLFGPATRGSIGRYQSSQELDPTGYLDEAQQAQLLAKAEAASLLASLKRDSAAVQAQRDEMPAEAHAESGEASNDAPASGAAGAATEESGASPQLAALPPAELQSEDQAEDEPEAEAETEPEQEPEIDWVSRARDIVVGQRAAFEEDVEDYNESRNLFSKVTSSHDTRIDKIRGLRVVSANSIGAKIAVTVTNKATTRNDIRTITVTLDARWSGETLQIIGHK